eukprot:7476-Heterococcus_DN1.PRE.2
MHTATVAITASAVAQVLFAAASTASHSISQREPQLAQCSYTIESPVALSVVASLPAVPLPPLRAAVASSCTSLEKRVMPVSLCQHSCSRRVNFAQQPSRLRARLSDGGRTGSTGISLALFCES